MKILEWNINQRSNYNGLGFIPEWLNEEIKKTDADIVVLTEFYKTENWLSTLAYKLCEYNVFTNTNENGNEILISVKKEIKVVDTKELPDDILSGNFLQIKILIDGKLYTIIGFRVRAENGEGKEKQFKELIDYLKGIEISDSNVIVIGDFNLWDTYAKNQLSIPERYRIHAPIHQGDTKSLSKWSYVFKDEGRAPLDWVIVKNIEVKTIDYSWEFLKQIGKEAGKYKSNYIGIPDHAQLIVEFEN